MLLFSYCIALMSKPFLYFFPRSFSSPTLICRAHLPLTSLQKQDALTQHHPCQHHLHHLRHYRHCHRLFGYTRCSFDFNWQLEVISEVVCLSPSEATYSSSLLLVVFWLMSLWLDVSNLPLKIPQQMSSSEQVVPLESCLLPQECRRGRCLSVCYSAALVLRSRLRTLRTWWNMMCFLLCLADEAEELVEKSATVALLVLITAFFWTLVRECTEISCTDV